MNLFKNKQEGFSLVEVLASIVLIAILFSIISSYILNSIKISTSISNKYSAAQIAQSLLDSYKAMDFTILSGSVNTVVPVDVKTTLNIDPTYDLSNCSANVEISKYENPSFDLSTRVLKIKVTVLFNENGINKATILEGYKRK